MLKHHHLVDTLLEQCGRQVKSTLGPLLPVPVRCISSWCVATSVNELFSVVLVSLVTGYLLPLACLRLLTQFWVGIFSSVLYCCLLTRSATITLDLPLLVNSVERRALEGGLKRLNCLTIIDRSRSRYAHNTNPKTPQTRAK